MKPHRTAAWRFFRRPACLALTLVFLASAFAWAAEPPKPGATLPPGLSLQGPLPAADREYLGVGDAPVFKLSEVKAPFILLEVIGVYCPQCHVQAPHFDKLYNRVKQDPVLSGQLRMLGLAAGATKEEMDYLRESGVYKYPVAGDSEFAAHKLLGEPKTPFTMLLDAKGKVLYAHLGIIEDMNAFYDELLRLTR